MKFSLLKISSAAALFAVMSVSPALAVSLTLEGPSTVIAQQTTQNPCIFGDPSCNNPTGFDYTLFPTNPAGDIYDEMSPVYTVEQLVDIANSDTFAIGIDVNTAAGTDPEILQSFVVTVNGAEAFSFVNGVDGSGVLDVPNNGTGFSDARLLGIDLSSYDPTDMVKFFVNVSRVSNGRENFFIIAEEGNNGGGDPVPEPGTMALLMIGLVGLISAKRRAA